MDLRQAGLDGAVERDRRSPAFKLFKDPRLDRLPGARNKATSIDATGHRLGEARSNSRMLNIRLLVFLLRTFEGTPEFRGSTG